MRLRDTIAFISFLALPAALYSDIIKLETGEILNGKIIQQSSDSVVFASSAKTLTVQRTSIIEIFKTSSPEEDRKLLVKLGKSVSTDEIRTNYKAGEEKLEQFLSTGTIAEKKTEPAQTAERALFIYGGAVRTTDSFSGTFPWGSCGGIRFLSDACSGDPGFRHSFSGDLSACRFARRGKSLTGGVLAPGYLAGWQTGYGCPFLSGSAGPGLFRVDDGTSAVSRFKPTVMADAGLIFFASNNFIVSPVLRMIHVYDRSRSLTGVSVLLTAGAVW